jgi:hypothetical protein
MSNAAVALQIRSNDPKNPRLRRARMILSSALVR